MSVEEEIDAQLEKLLKEEEAKDVIAGRQTLPITLPAKKQLALDILRRMADRTAKQG